MAGAQEYNNLKVKRVAVNDSIQIDSVSINPSYFRLMDKMMIITMVNMMNVRTHFALNRRLTPAQIHENI
jgi:hypothetical protein